MMRHAPRLSRFARDERGLISAYNLFFTVAACIIGALAVDVTRWYEARSQLQVSADLAAHAALYTRRYGSYESEVYHPITDAEATAAAISAVEFGAPSSFFGETIDEGQVVLGYWNNDTDLVDTNIANVLDGVDAATLALFQHVPDSAAVITDRAGANPVRNFLFRMAGLPMTNVATGAVFTLAPGECDPTQGFFSKEEVQMNGQNLFFPGFCVGAPKVWVRNGNDFRPGVAVVTETLPGLDLSGSDVELHNPGLLDAHLYGEDHYTPVYDYMDAELGLVTTPLTGLAAGLGHFADHGYAYTLLAKPGWTQVVPPTSLTAPTIITVANDLDVFYPTASPTYSLTNPSRLPSNTVHVIQCSGGNKSITLKDDTTTVPTANTFKNMVILTNCQVTFDGSTKLEDFILSTTNTSGSGQWSISTSAGLTVGRNDHCDPVGGAALITHGGFNAAADVHFFGALLRVVKAVNFQSNAVGEGVSIISGGKKLDTNSQIRMAACGEAANTVSTDVSFRLLR